jgi:hypothetical protein
MKQKNRKLKGSLRMKNEDRRSRVEDREWKIEDAE